jgi:hypothetical protein
MITDEDLDAIGDALARAVVMFPGESVKAARNLLDRLASRGFELRRREDEALVFVRGRVEG